MAFLVVWEVALLSRREAFEVAILANMAGLKEVDVGDGSAAR